MRELLLLVAGGAGVWAITVLGVATNRPLGAFLLAVALGLVVAAHNEQGLKAWWNQRRLKGSVLVALVALVVVSAGWYLLTNFNEAPQTGNDTEARAQAREAQRQVGNLRTEVGNLRTEVGTLSGQVKAALDFQQTAKEAQDARDRATAAERARRQKAREALVTFIDSGRALDLEIRQSRSPVREKVDEWIAQLEAVIRRVLDETYVKRSRDAAGITLLPRGWKTLPPQEVQRALFDLDIRIARIQEFLKELSD